MKTFREEVALVYSFDNINQVKLLRKSIQTITSDINIILLVKKEISKEQEVLDLVSESNNIKIVEINFPTIKGMFYWLMSPHQTEYKYLIQCDNDLLFKKVDFEKLLKKYKSKLNKNFFLGVPGHFWRVEKNRMIIKSQRKNFIDYFTKINKYINTGFVIVNAENIRNKISSEEMLEKIEFHKSEMIKNKWKFTDQEFISIYFHNKISFIHNRYNLRINNLFLMKRNYKKNQIIYHYNLWRNIDGVNRKFDFIGNFDMHSNEEFAEMITSYWLIGNSESKKNIYKEIMLDMLSFSNNTK